MGTIIVVYIWKTKYALVTNTGKPRRWHSATGLIVKRFWVLIPFVFVILMLQKKINKKKNTYHWVTQPPSLPPKNQGLWRVLGFRWLRFFLLGWAGRCGYLWSISTLNVTFFIFITHIRQTFHLESFGCCQEPIQFSFQNLIRINI